MKVCLKCNNKYECKDWVCNYCNNEPRKINGFLSFVSEEKCFDKGFDRDFFSKLSRVEAGNFWFRSRNKLIKWGINKYFESAKSFLEIGCGTGNVISHIEKCFPGLELYGCEIFIEGLEIASKRVLNAVMLQIDAREIPFENEFNIIGAFDVIEHINEDELVLSQMYQAVNKGGGIIITVPQHPFLWSFADNISFHKRRYTAIELKSKVERAGFKVDLVTSFITLLFPMMLISRILKKHIKPANSNEIIRELELNVFLNRLFEIVCSLELFLIRLGIRLPFGGSIMVIGRKES